MADYAIHDTTLIAQANILRKKFGTNDRQDPADYADKMNLMGKLEEKTVSGSIVTFSDGADDVPLKSCTVTIAPNLDGVSSVDVVKTGKNLIKPDKYQASSNILMIGQNDGTSFDTFLKAGTYTISYITTGDSCYIYRREENDVSNTNMGKRLSVTFTIESDGNFRFWLYGDGAVSANISNVQLEIGSTITAYEPYVTPTTHTANLGRTIYGGTADVVNGTGTDENGNDFTFSPVPIITRLGDNTLWSDGDLSVVYRSSGTVTKIAPLLMSKAITENGTYTASDDGLDGYDAVVVNVSGGVQNIETVLSSNPLIEVSGVSGTDVERTMWTYTASASGKIVFHSNTQVKTNTGSNDGYFTVKKNGNVIATTYATTSTTTSLPIPDIDIESGDVVTITCGFDNSHTSCWFDIYSTITILTESAPSLLMGGFGSSNSESENEELNEEAESEEE